jgi:hypothetical protein
MPNIIEKQKLKLRGKAGHKGPKSKLHQPNEIISIPIPPVEPPRTQRNGN